MAKTVQFQFDMDQEVRTPFGENGIVAMQGNDGEGIQYFIKTAASQMWYKEKQITPRG